MKINNGVILCFVLVLVLNLTACGGMHPEKAGEGRAVSEGAVSGTAISGSAVDDGTAAKSDVQAKIDKALNAYKKYIEKEQLTETISSPYTLMYLDDDDIPELLLGGACEAAGNTLLYLNTKGKVATADFERLNYCFMERSGLIVNCGGHMGRYYDHVFELKNGTLKKIGTGDYYSKITEDEKEVFTYYWNKEKVDKKTYKEKLTEVYPDCHYDDYGDIYPDYRYDDYGDMDDTSSDDWKIRTIEKEAPYSEYETLDLAYEALTGTLTVDLSFSLNDLLDDYIFLVKENKVYISCINLPLTMANSDEEAFSRIFYHKSLKLPLSENCEWTGTDVTGSGVEKMSEEDFMSRFSKIGDELETYNDSADAPDLGTLTVSIKNGTAVKLQISLKE